MTRAEFEPAIPATKRQQTYTLDPAATGIGIIRVYHSHIDFEGRVTEKRALILYMDRCQVLS
jgi:hypothetical protein